MSEQIIDQQPTNAETLQIPAAEKTQEKERSFLERVNFFSRDGGAHVRHAPLNYFVNYKMGLEKSILDGIKMEMHSVCINFEWDKRFVHYRIEKIQNHPHIEPGYIYELIYNGDGHSYLSQILSAFKDRDSKNLGIPLSNSSLVIVHYSGLSTAGIESEYWKDPNRNHAELATVDKLQFLAFKENINPTKPLYKDNYIPFYIASVLFWASVASLPLAGLFKHVWVNKEKTMVNKVYYTEDKYMPIQSIRAATDASQGSESERLLAIRYSTSRGWHLAVEQRQEGTEEPVRLEKKIMKDGALSDAVPSIQEDSRLMGIPAKKAKTDDGKTAGQKTPAKRKKEPGDDKAK